MALAGVLSTLDSPPDLGQALFYNACRYLLVGLCKLPFGLEMLPFLTFEVFPTRVAKQNSIEFAEHALHSSLHLQRPDKKSKPPS